MLFFVCFGGLYAGGDRGRVPEDPAGRSQKFIVKLKRTKRGL
jgi:hypothetical protein